MIKALATFPEEPGSTPRTHMAAYNLSITPFPGDPRAFSGLCGCQACARYTNMHAEIIPMHIK